MEGFTKIKHVRESDFKEMEFEFPNEKIELLEEVRKRLMSSDVDYEITGNMTNDDGSKLFFGATDKSIKNRVLRETGGGTIIISTI